MNNLLTRFALWLNAYLGLTPLDVTRIHNGADAVARGSRWQAFYTEDGGLADMILAVRKGYFEGAAGLSIEDTAKLYEYAMADRIAREIERQVLGVIATGKIEADRIAATARSMSAQIRR